jgi:hypothetical protein
MEARAGDEQSISADSASSVALLQVARSPSSAAQQEEVGNVSDLAQFDVASPRDGSQPISQGLDLDISLEQIGGLYETVDDNERNSARVARIASPATKPPLAAIIARKAEPSRIPFPNPPDSMRP